MILAIDPGPSDSAVVGWDGIEVYRADILGNQKVLDFLREELIAPHYDVVVIEMVACYGMPVGKEVFETVRWVGRFEQAWQPAPVRLVYRQEVKLHHCKSARAKDSNIRQALIDKYGPPGTKKEAGVTYGLKSHLWAAFAIATYVSETSVIGNQLEEVISV